MKKLLGNVLSIALLAGVVYFFHSPLSVVYYQMRNKYFPCQYPVSYRINDFDNRFGISRENFLAALKQAEAIWEKPLGKNLFEYDEGGYLKVNLVYDARQASTQQLEQVGSVVKDTKESYDQLVAEYNAQTTAYRAAKATFESRLAAFNTRKAAYESEVSRVNQRGGADKATYSKLSQEKAYLTSEMNALAEMQSDLNAQIAALNALGTQINKLAANVNAKVRIYNSIGDNLGGEFDEGIYKSDITGQEIDIYQFDNQAKLVRVLAHELGHSLGLDHIDDPKAIMYRLNDGENEAPTKADIAELNRVCKIQ